jgi:Na+/H+-dicarboxylate symporter
MQESAEQSKTRIRLPWHWALHWQILLGLVIGALIGWWIGAGAIAELPAEVPSEARGVAAAEIAKQSVAYIAFDLIGDLFIQGLKLIIVPLVTSSIILAVANIGVSEGFGRLGGKTLLYYGSTSLIAILIGLTMVNIISPGIGEDGTGLLVGRDISTFASDQAAVTDKTGGKGAADFLNVFREMVPPNIVAAAAEGALLGLIVVSMLVGFFLARLNTPSQQVLLQFVEGVYDITLRITDVVLAAAPIGVLGLLAATVGEQYAKLTPDARFAEFATGILVFAGTAFAALMLHLIITMPVILVLIARVNPLRHLRAVAPALITGFSTASSSATLPLTIDCVEKRAGVSRRTASFTLPLGATVNMDGTALYECVAAIFICQAFGIELTVGQQFMIVVTALLTSIGVAGVPAASLVAIVVILNAVQAQLPEGAPILVAGLGLLFVFDRPLDMCRTAVNIFSDTVAAVTIAKTEGETPLAK